MTKLQNLDTFCVLASAFDLYGFPGPPSRCIKFIVPRRQILFYLKGSAPMPPAPLVWKCACEVAKWQGVSENCGCQAAKWRWPPEASRGPHRPGGSPGGPGRPFEALLGPFWGLFGWSFWEHFFWWLFARGSLGDPFGDPFGDPLGPL